MTHHTDATSHAPQLNRRHALALAAGTALAFQAGCAQLASTPASGAAAAGPGFDAWAESFAADWVRQSAERVTFSQYFSGAEQAAFERQLTPQTAERQARSRELARAGLARLAAFEAAGLSPTQRTDAATLRWSLQRAVAGEPFEDHNFAFNQLGGPQVSLISFMSEAHPMRNAADVDAYVERLRQVDVRMDEVIARARGAIAKGLLPPRFILDRSRTQVQAFLVPAPEKNLFVTALERRSASIAGLTPEARQQAIAEATKLVAERIRPAWQRVDALLAEIQPRTNADAGLWRFADGAAAYEQALATYTTTTLNAEQIHAIGLREVARIEGEMDRVLQSLGYKDGTVLVRMTALNATLQPPAQPDPRAGLIAKHSEYVRDNIRRSQSFFNLQPKAPVEVRREPPLTEKTAAAHYTTPAPDGSRPGVFWAPLPGPEFNIANMRSLAVHEAVPGHHFQLAIQQEQTSLPKWRQRRIFGGGSAHSEGWGLYAERLAIDNGWYDGDPVQLLGALDSQLFRARRLVVDTGLHTKKWTREQAIAYGIGAQEVERYVSNPGQACAYMIGMLRMLELREEARKTLGAKFDVKAFHDVLLSTGSVPLDVLGDVTRRWAAGVA
jgi:uncharacterized protein (DUF885 family)